MIDSRVIGMIGDYPPLLGGIATHVKEIVNVLSMKKQNHPDCAFSKIFF